MGKAQKDVSRKKKTTTTTTTRGWGLRGESEGTCKTYFQNKKLVPVYRFWDTL